MGKKTRRQRLAVGKPPTTKASDAAASHAVNPQHLKLDPRGDGMYSGTFRWLESKVFPQLPPFPSHSVDLSAGWKEFLASRSSPSDHVDLVATATYDPSMLDALSFPVTLLHVTQLLALCKGPQLRVLVVGASQKAEQRVWRITNYWNEVAAFYAKTRVTLFFIGPEVDERDTDRVKDDFPCNLTVRHFKGTFGDFQDSQLSSDCTRETSVIVGYNTGFGNFVDSHRHELLFSWLPDLYRIAESEIPAIFTCANDYADMNGEFAVQSRIVGAKMLLLPKQNPFSAASHFHEEGQRDTAWSRGSSFMYVVCGVDKDRRFEADGDMAALQKRLDADLDIHLQDKLGRHFYKGMVLTKDQASRCKALNGNQTIATAQPKQTKSANAPQADHLETPRFELMPGQRENELVAAILVPKVTSTSERIAVDLTDSILTVFVAGKYLLKTKLPFQVDEAAGSLQAVLTLPILRVSFRKK
ncbi:hypothetical protein V7S43_013501 [Phytophthora oleae]|uniref:Mitochondrial splicing suppressor 51-like C-terminal domain-containing protein n=1 Tax=Phytophthora oleae TaxID=2107226 RepID=A0ABD3F444_9STRA